MLSHVRYRYRGTGMEGKKNQRTVFGQGPCQAYLRHAHIVLFGKRFDTGVFERKAGGGVMDMSFRGER
jgi:hypothetical protein